MGRNKSISTIKSKKYIVPDRPYLDPDDKLRLEIVCNRINKRPREAIGYLLDVEEFNVQQAELDSDAEKIWKLFKSFLDKVREVNPRAYTIFTELMRK